MAISKIVVISVNYVYNVPFWYTWTAHSISAKQLNDYLRSWMKAKYRVSHLKVLVVKFCEVVALYAVSCGVGSMSNVYCIEFVAKRERFLYCMLLSTSLT